MKPVHIKTTDATAAIVVAELGRVGQDASWGPDAPGNTKWIVTPKAPEGDANADRIDASEVLRVCRNLRDAGADHGECATFTVDVARLAPVLAPVLAPSIDQTTQGLAHDGRPRVLHIVPWPNIMGGGPSLVNDWCQAEAARWDIHLLTPTLNPSIWPLGGAVIHNLPAARDQVALIAQLQPDLVVLHNCDHPAARSVSRRENTMVFMHGEQIVRNPSPTWLAPRGFISNYPPQNLDASWQKVPATYARLGVDLAAFSPVAPLPEDGNRQLVCGIVGRLSPEKLPMSFVKALADFDPGRWVFRFIGAGALVAYQTAVKAALRGVEHVEFIGDIPTRAMPAMYQACDAVLIPSATDTGSYAAAEAMACGLPLVARRVGGIPFTTGACAVLLDTDRELLHAVRCFDNVDARAAAGTLNRGWAVEHLGVARQMAEHTAAYASTLSPLLSVIMPVWNTDPAMLREAYASLQAQTMLRWELILVDDGSDNDVTLAAEEDIAEHDGRVRFFRRPHRGIGAARAYALTKVLTPLVAIADSDDVNLPERFAVQMAYLRAHRDVDMVSAQVACIGDPFVTSHPLVLTPEYAATHDWFTNQPAAMMRLDALQLVGGYDPQQTYMEDFGVFLSMVAAGMQLRTLPQTLVRYRLHPTQISAVHRADLPAAALAVRAEVNAKAVTLRFANIYRTKWWGDGCPSGDGSEADHTAPLVAPIADLLAGYGVASVLDIGCGWSPWLEAALGTARYLGIDAVQSVIDKRRRRAAVGCTFVLHDLTTEPMADAFDIAVARDVMGHLPDAVVLEMLRNVTSSTYMLLATHWPDAGVVPDIAVGMWRRIDLCRAPFNLPPPVESIAEVDAGKTLALFDLSDWPA